MAYDLHGSWEQDLGHHASLFPGPGDDTNDKKLTVVGVAHIHEYRYSCMFQIFETVCIALNQLHILQQTLLFSICMNVA